MTPKDTGATDDAWWAAVGARALHPTQVMIIEALRWIDHPLSAGDLAFIFDEKYGWRRLVHYLRGLRTLGVVAHTNVQTLKEVVTAPMCLVKQLQDSPQRSEARPSADPRWQVEHALLIEILDLHPTHLTDEELILRIAAWDSNTDALMVEDLLCEFRRCGLVRAEGEIIGPTFPALRTYEIITRC